jgi:hypothetical protein
MPPDDPKVSRIMSHELAISWQTKSKDRPLWHHEEFGISLLGWTRGARLPVTAQPT